jgi:hypothetical protein
MAGKYTPLEHYLRDLPINQKEVTLSFDQIERVLNDKLPPSAHKFQEWWSPEKHPRSPQKQAMGSAGWKVDTVDFRAKWVRFVRQ